MAEASKLKIACPACQQKLDVSDLSPFARIPCPACGQEVIAPQEFAGILLEEPLSEGGDCSVYRALDLTLDREVAVKRLDAAVAQVGGCGERFLSAARKAATINHSNIVPIYSCGEEENQPYIVSQFMSGGSLENWMTRADGERTVAFATKAGTAVARGLSILHRNDHIHYALTPPNIMLDIEGNVKIMDVGIWHAIVVPQGARSDSPADWGRCVCYLSPEQLLGGVVDWRTDLFSLGAVLYHLLVGRPPVLSEDSPDVVKARRELYVPPSPAALDHDIPKELSDLTMELLASEPKDRPQNIEDVAKSLDGMARKSIGASRKKTNGIVVLNRRDGGKHPETKIPGRGKSGTGKPSGSTARKRKSGDTRGAATALVPSGNERFVNRLLIGAFIALIILLVLYLHRQQSLSEKSVGATVPTTVAERSDKDTTVANDGGARTRVRTQVPDVPSPLGKESDNRAVPATPPSSTTETRTASLVTPNALRAKRPRPRGLDFAGSRNELTTYLAGLPATEHALDEQRLRAIEHSRDYLSKLMRYLPFREGANTRVKLRDGTTINGAVPYCNRKTIGVRIRASGSTRIRKVPWTDLAFEQYIEFFDYYMNVRIKQGGKESEAATDCLRLALLCEWYGRDSEAIRYARQTVVYDAKYAGTVRRLVPQAAK